VFRNVGVETGEWVGEPEDRSSRSRLQARRWVEECTWSSKQWMADNDCPYTAFGTVMLARTDNEAQKGASGTRKGHAAYLVANSSGEGRWCGELEREYQILY
jgi:hypothetical protein